MKLLLRLQTNRCQPHRANVQLLLCCWPTSLPTENGELRFQGAHRGLNINALAAASSPALTAVVARSGTLTCSALAAFTEAQRPSVPSARQRQPDGKDTQTLVDDAVAGSAPLLPSNLCSIYNNRNDLIRQPACDTNMTDTSGLFYPCDLLRLCERKETSAVAKTATQAMPGERTSSDFWKPLQRRYLY